MKRSFLAFTIIIGLLTFSNCKKKDKTETPTPSPTPAPAATLPSVTTGSISGIVDSTASCGGNVTAEGSSALTAVGICWDTQPSPTTLRSKNNIGAGTGTFTAKLNNLKNNTTYYVRAYATNASGTAYGSEVSFKSSTIWTKTSFGGSSVYGFHSKGNDLFTFGQYGINKTTDNGLNWTNVSSTQNIGQLVSNQSGMYASTYGTGVIYSTDNGNTWAATNLGLTDQQVTSIAINGSTLIVATNSGPFLSTNNGSNWAIISSNLPNSGVTSVAISGNSLFVLTYNNGVYVSTDNGATWVQKNVGLPTSGQIVELSGNGLDVYGLSQSGFYLAQNGGNSWTKLSIPASYLNAFAASGTQLMAASQAIVYLSTNNGTSWKSTSQGIPQGASINALVFHGDNMFAGISWNEIYKKPVD